MIRFRSECIGVILLASVLLVTVRAADAQQPRMRTLTYDAARKEWVEQAPPQPGTAAGELHAVRLQIKERRYRAALAGIKKFIEKHGPSEVLYPDILIAKAEALIGRREYYKAHEGLQAFLSEFGQTPLASEARRLEFVIADAFLGGVKRKIAGIRLLDTTDTAYRILDDIAVENPDTRLAELAIKTKADHLFNQGDHSLAELEYARMLREYPQSRYEPFCLRRSADAALASFGGVDYDEGALLEAEERYREYRLRYAGEADREGVGLILDGIREARAEKDFSVGAYYERTRHVSSAIFYYQMVRGSWPDTLAATKAKARLELLGALGPATSVGTAARDPSE